MRKLKETIVVTIEVPFYSYENKKLDDLARREIKRWIKETVENELSYIPMYVEKDNHGSYLEDCSRKTKISIRQE